MPRCSGDLLQGNVGDAAVLQANEVAPAALLHEVDRSRAEPGGEDPIERGRAAAALEVAEYGDP